MLVRHLNSMLSSEDHELVEAIHASAARSIISDSAIGTANSSGTSAGAAIDAEEYVWMFAYGSNMEFSSVARREVKVASRDPALIRDPNVAIVFKHRGGHATLEALAPGQKPRFPPLSVGATVPHVHGVLYKLRKSDLKRLQQHEQGYTLTEMEVETYDGRVARAHVFVSGPLARLQQEVVPPECYMRSLREGAAFNFLDPVHQAWLSSIDTVTSAGLGAEYYATPGRYVTYSLLTVVGAIVCAFLSQHM